MSQPRAGTSLLAARRCTTHATGAFTAARRGVRCRVLTESCDLAIGTKAPDFKVCRRAASHPRLTNGYQLRRKLCWLMTPVLMAPTPLLAGPAPHPWRITATAAPLLLTHFLDSPRPLFQHCSCPSP
jgi:hypothetical protein